MHIIWLLINLSLLGLILFRIPNTTNSALDIDQNPKFLNSLLTIFTGLFLTLGMYSNFFEL